MKCPVCGSRLPDADAECPRCAVLARRGISLRRARAERLVTTLLVTLLVVGLIGLATVTAYRHERRAQALQRQQAARQAAFDTEAEDAPTDDAPAARKDAQGDQASDE